MRISDWSSDVCSSDLLYRKINTWLPVNGCGADGRRGPLNHLAHIPEAYRQAILVKKGSLRKLLRGERLPFGIDDDALVIILDKACPAYTCCLGGCLHDLLQRDVVANQFLGIDLDLELAHLAAEYVDIGDTFHRQQMRANGPVHERSELHQRTCLGGQSHAEHRAGRRGEWCDVGRDAGRQMVRPGRSEGQ